MRLVISCVWWGMLTFFGLARLPDATLVQVFFNVQNCAMLRFCTFSSIYRTTRCYATAGSIRCIELRGATPLHVLYNIQSDATWTGVGGGWVGGGVGDGGC